MGVWTPGTVTLAWPEGHYLHGLEIVCRRVTIGEVIERMEVEQHRAVLSADRPLLETWTGHAQTLVDIALSWNAIYPQHQQPEELRGQPVPMTAEGVMSVLGLEELLAVLEQYRAGTSQLAPPLSQPSDGGSRSEEPVLDLPMVPMSDSPRDS